VWRSGDVTSADAPGVVCVFAKPARPGEVKTRLAAEIGPGEAARLATAFLEDTLVALRRLPLRVVLASTEPGVSSALADECWEQGDGELGERLERVLCQALGRAPWAAAIGADSPGFPLAALEEAEAMLSSVDVALGPADDGGFYLMATRRCPPQMLAGVTWSVPDTLLQVERRFRTLGLSTGRVAPWFDVDTLESLRRLAGLMARGEVRAAATAQAIAGWAR
jgi:rSAM/selenodomain-associated transferase 1